MKRDVAWLPVTSAVLLMAVTILAYLPALRAGYVWDDGLYVTENMTLRSFDGLRQIWLEPSATTQYYPLTFTTFWVEYHLWGTAPLGYHLVNVLLHAGNAILVWVILRQLAVPGAWLASALFALHPVHVESVAWVSERKDVLSGTCYLLAVLLWLRFVETAGWKSYVAASVLFLCAMLSKTSTCTLPLALLLLAWWKGRPRLRRTLALLLPWAVAAVGLGAVTAWREHLDTNLDIIRHHLSLPESVLVAVRAVWFYAAKLLWPTHLVTIYPRWEIDPHAAWQYAFPAAAVAVPAILWLWRRLGRAPVAAALYFGFTLGPALGFADFNFMEMSYVADHFQYLPSIGLIALLAAAATRVMRRWTEPVQRIGYAGAAALLLLLGVLSWQQTRIYQDQATLWRHNVAENPHAWMARYNLGATLQAEGNFDAAIEQYMAAIRIRPDYLKAQINCGKLLQLDGKLDEARERFADALQTHPDSALARFNLGAVLDLQGKTDAAIEQYAAALQIDPQMAVAHYNWAVDLERQGKLEDAINQYAAAARIDPENALVHYRLGTLLGGADKPAEAIEHFKAAVRLKPDFAEAQMNWGTALGRQGKLQEAITHYRAALQIRPDDAQAQANLQAVLALLANRAPESRVP